MRVGVQRYAPATFTPGKDSVPIVQEAGWAPGLVWIGAKNLAPTGIRFPDLPARSESLYRLRYPGSSQSLTCKKCILSDKVMVKVKVAAVLYFAATLSQNF
jgi:hypothetical protein